MNAGTIFAISTIAMALVACGGGGGSGGGGGDGGSGDGGSGGVTAPTQASLGAPYARDGTNYSLTLGGREFTTSYVGLYVNSDQPVMRSINLDQYRMIFAAIDGDAVDGLAVAHYGVTATNDGGAGFGITGTLPQSRPTGAVQYDGVFVASKADANHSDLIFNDDITLAVNFDAGRITGQTIAGQPSEQMVTIMGTLDGNSIRLNIDSRLGAYDATGSFFGNNAAELAAGFAKGNVAGLLYGTR